MIGLLLTQSMVNCDRIQNIPWIAASEKENFGVAFGREMVGEGDRRGGSNGVEIRIFRPNRWVRHEGREEKGSRSTGRRDPADPRAPITLWTVMNWTVAELVLSSTLLYVNAEARDTTSSSSSAACLSSQMPPRPRVFQGALVYHTPACLTPPFGQKSHSSIPSETPLLCP